MLECGMVKSNRTISLMGEIFYDLRTQRNFRLTDFEKVGLSKSSLSDFESGKSILRFDKLDAALELTHIEVSEFEYFLTITILIILLRFVMKLKMRIICKIL